MVIILLFLQVLYTLTNWKWVKTALAIFFVISLAEIALGTGILITVLPRLIETIKML